MLYESYIMGPIKVLIVAPCHVGLLEILTVAHLEPIKRACPQPPGRRGALQQRGPAVRGGGGAGLHQGGRADAPPGIGSLRLALARFQGWLC